jgi:hypothetical protein
MGPSSLNASTESKYGKIVFNDRCQMQTQGQNIEPRTKPTKKCLFVKNKHAVKIFNDLQNSQNKRQFLLQVNRTQNIIANTKAFRLQNKNTNTRFTSTKDSMPVSTSRNVHMPP